jgi:hypothetical protein
LLSEHEEKAHKVPEFEVRVREEGNIKPAEGYISLWIMGSLENNRWDFVRHSGFSV